MVVPGDSAPGMDAGLLPGSSTVIEKDAAVAVPPLLLMTCLITVSCGAVGQLIVMLALAVSWASLLPSMVAVLTMVPQSAESEIATMWTCFDVCGASVVGLYTRLPLTIDQP